MKTEIKTLIESFFDDIEDDIIDNTISSDTIKKLYAPNTIYDCTTPELLQEYVYDNTYLEHVVSSIYSCLKDKKNQEKINWFYTHVIPIYSKANNDKWNFTCESNYHKIICHNNLCPDYDIAIRFIIFDKDNITIQFRVYNTIYSLVVNFVSFTHLKLETILSRIKKELIKSAEEYLRDYNLPEKSV